MTEAPKASLFQSMALGGLAASFAVNFTHPIVSLCRVYEEYTCFYSVDFPVATRMADRASDLLKVHCYYANRAVSCAHGPSLHLQETVKTRMQVSGLGIAATAG